MTRIQNAAERATRMVKDLLDFTQARLGERHPHRAAAGEPARADAGAWWTRWKRPSLPGARVLRSGNGQGIWDPDRLAQVVQNLVTNALKYSPEDTPVQVETRGDPGGVTLCVHNQGAPIPPEFLASIFQPLQRGVEGLDPVSRSVGLGLYIVKQVVDAHGGSVEVRSTPEAGTTFTVHLPRKASPR